MEQFKQFDLSKAAVIQSLDKLSDIFEVLEEIGVPADEAKQKILSIKETIDSDVLRVALMGAFSDGKTSVIAAWLGEVLENMNIDIDESSDAIAVYQPQGLPSKCEIVDTPGLFGDKEKVVDDQDVKYEDITRKYISEAHILLYVVNATNPLKDSHAESLKWVMRDLNKLENTIFIINKMDEVTDLTEPELFRQQAQIKKDNLTSKLVNILDLTSSETNNLNIVCVSANPGGRGLEFWFGKNDTYQTRSRINDLKEATNKVLSSSARNTLVAKTGLDVVKEQARNGIMTAQQHLDNSAELKEGLLLYLGRIDSDIDHARGEIKDLAINMREELNVMERTLLARLRPLELANIREFLEDYIGCSGEEVGFKLQGEIKGLMDRYYKQTNNMMLSVERNIGEELSRVEALAEAQYTNYITSAGTAIQGISKVPVDTLRTAIFTTRDLVANVTGYAFKFKPYGALNLAKGFSKWAGAIGLALQLGSDLFSKYQESELEAKLVKAKQDISGLIQEIFKEIHLLINDDDKLMGFFGTHINELKDVSSKLKQQVQDIEYKEEKLKLISNEIEALQLN